MTDPTITGQPRPELPPGWAYTSDGSPIKLLADPAPAPAPTNASLRRAVGILGSLGGLALSIIVASAIPDGPDPASFATGADYHDAMAAHSGTLMHILNRVADAIVGGAVAIVFMGFCLMVAQPLIAPNLDEATAIVQRAHAGEDVTEAQARVAAGVFVGAGLRLLALTLPLLGFGLFL